MSAARSGPQLFTPGQHQFPVTPHAMLFTANMLNKLDVSDQRIVPGRLSPRLMILHTFRSNHKYYVHATYTRVAAGETVRLTARGEYVTSEKDLICGKKASCILENSVQGKETGTWNMQMQPRSLGNETWHPVVWGYTNYDCY
jgi:hypothetical protein